MALFKVTGPFEIGGVAPGGTVELDESAVNVDALVWAGHVEPVKPAAKAKKDDG